MQPAETRGLPLIKVVMANHKDLCGLTQKRIDDGMGRDENRCDARYDGANDTSDIAQVASFRDRRQPAIVHRFNAQSPEHNINE